MVKDLNDPTNVDSVPAVLTPGEFVINKEASAMYGPLLEKINNTGLQQRHTENQQVVSRNMGGPLMGGYNTGGLVGFIKKEEGWRDKAYQDPGGIWTIGYGRTRNPDGSAIKPGQTTSREKEDSWLTGRVNQERAAVKQYGKEKGYDWNESQINALASFRYNGGQGMLEQVTAGGERDNDMIASKILEYNKQNIDGQLTPLAGLTKRRQTEASMFAGGDVPHTQQSQQETPVLAKMGPPRSESPVAGLGGYALQALQAQRQAPLQHTVSRKMTQPEYIQSVAAQGVSTQPMRDNMQRPLQLNEGGYAWYNPLGWFQDDEEQMPPMQPPPGSDESLLQFSSGEQQRIYALPIGDPDRVAAIESGQIDPTDGDLEWEEQSWRTNEALQRAQLQAAVTAPDAPGAEFIQSRVNALTDQLNSLGVPPTSQGVGTDVHVGGPDQPVLTQGQVPDLSPNAVGSARPVLDGTVPSPEQVINNQPQDIWGGMDKIQPYIPNSADEERVGGGQRRRADPEGKYRDRVMGLAAPEGYNNDLTVDGTSPEVVSSAQENVPWVQQKDTIKETIANLEVDDNPNVDGPAEGVTFNSAATGDLIAQGEQAVANPPEPGFLDKLKGSLSATFKDMFNPDSLARAALLMAGGMATGMSPKSAMAWAGKDLLMRNDAKHAATRTAGKEKSDRHYELMKGGKYTPESVNNFIKSGYKDPLVPVGSPLTVTGKSKTVFMEGSGKQVELLEVKQDGNTYHVDAETRQPVSPLRYHENADRVPGTREYDERISKDIDKYEGLIKESREEHDAVKVDGKTVGYNTKIVPRSAAGQAATFAIENNIPPNIMTGVVEGAILASSKHSALTGQAVSSKAFESFLEDQFVTSQVGDDALFKGADAKAITGLFGQYKSALSQHDPEKFGNMNSSTLTTMIVSKARPMWTALDPEIREEWEASAKNRPGQTGFTLYLQSELADGIQEGGI